MSKLKTAMVGFGFIAERGHAPAYAERGDVDVVAVADVSPARRARAAAVFPGAKLFATHEELLDAVGGSLDVVDVCTPPYVHANVALAAMDAGLHVVCEKPLATSERAARSMLSKAMEAKRVLFPAHNYRHAPVVKAVRSALAEGLVGNVHLVTLETFRPTHARGTAEWNPDWRRDARYAGGGIGMDHGPHTLYLAFEWLRSHPIAIAATLSSAPDATTEETFSARVRFPTGQALATLTWTAGFRRVIYTLHGERGAIRVEDDDVEVSVMTGGEGNRRWDVVERAAPSEWSDAGHAHWFASLFDDFRRAIVEEDYVSSGARDAYACIQVIEAGYRSAGAGGAELGLS